MLDTDTRPDPTAPTSVDPARRLFARPRFGPLAGGLLFWILSLWPTLLPRSWFMQGLISGVCAAIGWLLGLIAGHAVHGVLRRLDRRPSERVRRAFWWGLAVAGIAAVLIVIPLWYRWQNDQRDVMGMPGISIWSAIPVILLSGVVLGVLVLVGRLVVRLVRWLDRRVSRLMPLARARVAVAAVVVIAVVVVVNVGRRSFVDWADSSFGAFNETTPEDVVEPTSAMLSGSPDSLVAWDTLGFQGRAFTGGAPSAADIAEFTGSDADVLDPIRVYVGLDSAPTAAERTQLALDELERTGAFEREVLVVATATGTGWINPDAARTLEFMHGGDTAIVSQQYSFLPSWVAFLVDPSNASEVGADLYAAVHARWLELPEDDRPKMVVFGESLGSFGAEAAFDGDDLDASLDALTAGADGVLFVGPTTNNPIYSQLVDGRDGGSPTWRPELARVRNLRVVSTVTDIQPDDPTWSGPRILYLHHPTDAIGTWSPATLWRPPGWTSDPLGLGVPPRVTWFPIVTWVQESADLMAGFSAVPGFGHDYRNALTAAWSAVAPPDGWTPADTDRLQEHLGLG